MDGRARLLLKMGAFFQKNPECQNKELGVTAANLLSAGKALAEALASVNEHSAAHKALVQHRDAVATQLRSRLRNLITEAGHVLADDDVRWATLGVESPAEERAKRAPRAEQRKRKAEAAASAAAEKRIELIQRKVESARIKAEKARAKAERILTAASAAQAEAEAAAEAVARLEAELDALGGTRLSLVLSPRDGADSTTPNPETAQTALVA
jgi:hypothetical protein